MSEQNPTPRDPDDGTQNPYHSSDDEFIDEEEVEQRRSNVPMVAMVIALVVLAVTGGVIGYFVSGTSQERPRPVVTPSAQPTGPPTLPQSVDDYSREPGGGQADPAAELMTTSSNYQREGQTALLVVAVRPSSDPVAILEGSGARNIAEHDAGAFCALDEDDLDLCSVSYGNTVVLVKGLRDQDLPELVKIAREVAPNVA